MLEISSENGGKIPDKTSGYLGFMDKIIVFVLFLHNNSKANFREEKPSYVGGPNNVSFLQVQNREDGQKDR